MQLGVSNTTAVIQIRIDLHPEAHTSWGSWRCACGPLSFGDPMCVPHQLINVEVQQKSLRPRLDWQKD